MSRLACLVLLPLMTALVPGGDEKPRTDLYGDPLPDGVRVRCGTVRLRAYYRPAVEFSRDGKTLRTSTGHNAVRFWDAATGKRLRELKGPDGEPVYATALSPDGKLLAGTGPKGVYLWDADTLRLVRRLGSPSWDAVAWLLDGKAFVTTGPSGDGTVTVWDTATGEERRQLKSDLAAPPRLVPLADGRGLLALLVGGGRGVAWDVTTGKELGRMHLPLDHAVEAVVALPDGSILLAGSRPTDGGRAGLASVRDPRTGKEVRALPGVAEPLTGAVLSADGKTLFLSEEAGPVRAFDLATGAELARWPAAGRVIAVSLDGTVVAVGGDVAVSLWDAATGKPLHDRPGHDGWVNAVAFTPDGQSVVSATDRRDVRVWDAATGKQRYRLAPPDGDAAGWDGFVLLGDKGLSGGGGDAVRVWDAATGKPDRTIPVGEGQRLVAVSALPGGKRIGCVGYVPIEQRRGKLVVSVLDLADGKVVLAWEAVTTETDLLVCPPTVSPDGRRVAYAHGGGNKVTVRDLADGKNPVGVETADTFIDRVLFHPDGKTLVVRSLTSSDPPKYHVRVCDAATGRELRAHRQAEFGLGLALSPTGRTVVLADGNHVRLFAPETGKDVWRSPDLGLPAWGFAFSPDGKTLASGMIDGTVLLWDVPPAAR